jgi:DNA-binding GntR family transcriptional regulator
VTINRTVLREQIKELLLERILNGSYQPGDRLVELQLAQEFGTSQAPVREALRELESMRFVESRPFKGTRVRTITPEEMAEVYPVRAALEELAGREAALRLDGNLDALRCEYDAMVAAAEAGDRLTQVHHDVAFHRLIVDAAGNQILAEVWRSLRIEARTLITSLKADVDLDQVAALHKPILDAFETGDPERVGRALRQHVETFARLLKAHEQKTAGSEPDQSSPVSSKEQCA